MGLQPRIEIGPRFHFDRNRHEAVIEVTQFSALAAINADPRRSKPNFIHDPGIASFLTPEGWHRKA
jgi:hypothetical protein